MCAYVLPFTFTFIYSSEFEVIAQKVAVGVVGVAVCVALGIAGSYSVGL